MIRVAFDTTPLSLGGGGVATYARELRHGLEEDPNVAVHELRHEATAHASGKFRITAGVSREANWYPRGLAHAARAANVDLIHTPAAMPVRGHDLPVVMTIHDAIPWRHPEWFTKANAIQQRVLVGGAARAAQLVLTDSDASRRDIIEFLRVDPERVETIHLGISPDFSPTLRDPEWLSSRFGTSGPVVLSVGTPEPRKNLAATVSIFERVITDIPDATLLLVGGDGWGADEIGERITRLGPQAIRTGHMPFDDLTRTYASADCFLFPSLLEGFGLPPLEAMASGTPVVCSNRPSLPEVVGEAARTMDPHDIEGLAGAVTSILTNVRLARELRRLGLEQAGRFPWSRTVEQTIAAYRRALE